MLILPFSAPSTYLYYINTLQKQPIRDLRQIAILAAERLEENDRFARQVKSNIPEQMDAVAHRLNQSIEKQIDCTVCGNCCKSLMINVSES